MTKEEIAYEVYLTHEDYTMRQCKEIVTAVFDCIADGIDEDGRAEFRRFGVFRTMEKTARFGRNPKTMEPAEIPARKDRPVKLDLPKIQSAQDINNVMGLIVENVGKGELEPEQAKTLATILEVNRKSIETAEIEERLLALERRGKV